MSFIVLVFGASGSGKSTLMENLARSGKQYSIHIKATNRPPRRYDGIEINCVSEVAPEQYDYIYETYGYSYGIQRAQIDNALVENRHHFIICNDARVIQNLKRDYGASVMVVFHHFDAPRERLLEIQKSRGISDDEIELRLAKTEALYKTFVDHGAIFDGVLHNRFGDGPEIVIRELERLLLHFRQPRSHPQIEEISLSIQNIEKIIGELELERRGLATTSDLPVERGFVFIVMAMRDDIDELADTHASIVRACQNAGLRGGRVDDSIFVGPITEKIHSSIRLAEYIVADLTQERPNVYYEVGFAHALGKPILLLARHGTSVHFDLHGHNIVFYRNLIGLEKSLADWLKGLRTPHRRKSDRQTSAKAQEFQGK